MGRKKILFTGGGTAGHVSLNLVLIPLFIQERWEVLYVGSKDGIEKQLISNLGEVKYFPICTGKLRRYFSWRNMGDIFRIIIGIIQSYFIIRRNKVNVIFSKGGFVSFPVVVGGWLNRVPILMHESDLTPGLANRLSMPFSSKVFTTFSETAEIVSSNKIQYIGPIVRESLKTGIVERGLVHCGFVSEKPVLLVMGGSLGAKTINTAIRDILPELLGEFQVIHICGKGQVDSSIDLKGYIQYEYIDKELPDIFAMSNIIVSRAGSNSIFEFLLLQKPMLLVPLPLESSRGDQILNAAAFQKKGYCEVMQNGELADRKKFIDMIRKVYSERNVYIENMKKNNLGSNQQTIFEEIKKISK